MNSDGSCAACLPGYYALNKICYNTQTTTQLTTSDTQTLVEQIKSDDTGNAYLTRGDGSRLYLTGPLKYLTVWSD